MLLEPLVPGDLAADVADHPAQPGAQEFEFAPRPLELMGKAVPADHDRRALGHPPIALPQRDAIAPGKIDHLLQRTMAYRASVGCAIAFGCTVVWTTTRSRSRVASAPVLCAIARLS